MNLEEKEGMAKSCTRAWLPETMDLRGLYCVTRLIPGLRQGGVRVETVSLLGAHVLRSASKVEVNLGGSTALDSARLACLFPGIMVLVISPWWKYTVFTAVEWAGSE